MVRKIYISKAFKWACNFHKRVRLNVCGIQLTEDTVWEIRKQVGMVFQNPDNQFVGATVQDDVAFALENNGIPRDDMVERVTSALEKVKMDDFLKSRTTSSFGWTETTSGYCWSYCPQASCYYFR